MAADILLYNADYVPTGEDQKQHVELARDIAIKFNSTFSPTFTIPEPFIKKEGSRIMSLKDPTHKMSKSDKDVNATIFITDEPNIIRKKIASAVTDSESKIEADAARPGITNLLNIYCAATGTNIANATEKFKTYQGYAPFKQELADCVITLLEPVQKKYKEIKDDKEYLLSVVKKGAETVQPIANKMISKVYRKIGFLDAKL